MLQTFEVYALLAVIAGLWFAPGALIASLVKRRELPILALLPCCSFAFYIAIVTLLDLVPRALGFALPDLVFTITVLASLVAGVFLVRRRADARLWRSMRWPLAFSLGLAFLCTYLTVNDHPDPMNSLDSVWIAHTKTFTAKVPHDNLFQYVNGRVLLLDETFEQHYGGAKLVYGPQDREIGPALVYSVFARVLSGIGPSLKSRFIVYHLWTITAQCSFFFPLAWLARRYFGKAQTPVLLAACSVSTAILVNVYYAWFKLGAAAFFLGGICCLLAARKRIWSWCAAGVAFGLASNFHASSALALPILLGVLAVQEARRRGLRDALKKAAILAGTFFAMIAPWSLFKTTHFADNNPLVRDNFVGGYLPPGPYPGLLRSAIQWVQQTPLHDQLTTRGRQLWQMFSWREDRFLWGFIREGKFDDVVFYWNAYEFRWLAFSLLSSLIVLVASWRSQSKRWRARDPKLLLTIALVQIPVQIGAMYANSWTPPHLSYHHSLSFLLVISLVAFGWAWNAGRFQRVLLCVLMVVAATRITAGYVVSERHWLEYRDRYEPSRPDVYP
jgi:hypothetical protein